MSLRGRQATFRSSHPDIRVGKAGPKDPAGSVQVYLMSILVLMFVVGAGYLFVVNRSAVQGYKIRSLEADIDRLKQQNAELKIAEADLRSLYRIESSEEARAMQKLDNVIYLEQRGAVAMR